MKHYLITQWPKRAMDGPPGAHAIASQGKITLLPNRSAIKAMNGLD